MFWKNVHRTIFPSRKKTHHKRPNQAIFGLPKPFGWNLPRLVMGQGEIPLCAPSRNKWGTPFTHWKKKLLSCRYRIENNILFGSDSMHESGDVCHNSSPMHWWLYGPGSSLHNVSPSNSWLQRWRGVVSPGHITTRHPRARGEQILVA